MGTVLAYSADEEYLRVAVEHYNLATPETACSWASIEPLPGEWDFTACDASLNFTRGEMNATWRGPPLVWGKLNPPWLEALSEPASKRTAMVEYVQKVIRQYGNASYSWEVVSEAITDDSSAADPFKKVESWGSETKEHVWYPDVPGYLEMAFMAARIAGGRSMKLLYSDYNIMSCAEGHWMKAKSDRVYDLVEGLANRSTPIDGIGMKMHLDLSWDEPSLYEGTRLNFARYEKLGLEVHVMDLDVSCESWGEEVEAQQAEMYSKILQICLDSPACKSFSTRGFTDKATPRGSSKHPLPFDLEYKPKAALFSMVKTMLDMAAPASNETESANTTASANASGNSSALEVPVNSSNNSAA